MSSVLPSSTSQTLHGLRVAFVGKLAGFSKRDAQQLVRAHGGQYVENHTDAELVVIGEAISTAAGPSFDDEARRAFEEGRLLAIQETQFWHRLGLIDQDPHITRMYTPAMLAELIKVPVAAIRRWHRRGLLVASRSVGHLHYFDFTQVATARQLGALASAGVSPRMIEKQFAALAQWLPERSQSKADGALIAEGKRLLLRQADSLLEAYGQQRFDFGKGLSESTAEQHENAVENTAVQLKKTLAHETPEELIELAQELDDHGQLELAAEMYRAAMAAGGPRHDVCFSLADVLYRLGDLAGARERYYMAVELDENFVEARANLGCVLAETGQLDLAVAAFEGAITHYNDFPDAHYHLARVLDELGRGDQAVGHWRTFLELAPDSPWADAARHRLGTE